MFLNAWLLTIPLTLTAASGVKGVVVDDAGPVDGVTVKVLSGPSSWDVVTSTDDERSTDAAARRRAFVRDAPALVKTLGRQSTAAGGRFAFGALPPGPVLLWADAGARGQCAQLATPGDDGVTMKLGPAYLLTGTTFTHYGDREPPRAEVVAVNTALPMLLHATTDKRGGVRLGYAPAGRYFVIGAGAGLWPHSVLLDRPVPPPAPAPPPPPDPCPNGDEICRANHREPPARMHDFTPAPGAIELAFFPACSLVGSVVDRGKPVAGARVELLPGSGGGPPLSRSTDAAGRYQFVDQLICANAGYEVRASKGDRATHDCVAMPALGGAASCCTANPRSTNFGDYFRCGVGLSLGAADAGQVGGARYCECQVE